MTSRLNRCGQSRLRPRCRASRRRRLVRIAVEPVLHDVVIELLAPEQAGVRLPRRRCRSSSVELSAGRCVGVELVGLARCARRTIAVEVVAERLAPAASAVGDEPQPHDDFAAGRNRRARSAPRPWCRCCCGLTALAFAVDDVVVKRVLARTAIAVRRRRRAAATLVSFSVNSSSRRRAVRTDVGRSQPELRRAWHGRATTSPSAVGFDARLAPRSLRACSPRTRCCGTTASAAGAASPPPGRDWRP